MSTDYVEKTNSKGLIELEVDDRSNYETFVALHDIIHQAYFETRVKAVWQKFGKQYNTFTEDYEITSFVNEFYPIRIRQWADGEKKRLTPFFPKK